MVVGGSKIHERMAHFFIDIYKIREYVFEHTGLKVSHLYIAQVKQKYGIIERENYNKPKSKNAKQPQCPLEKEKAITEALQHFGMI